MADPRFYRNAGPLRLADICARLGTDLPAGADDSICVADVSTIDAAGPAHLVFCANKAGAGQIATSHAGFALVETGLVAQFPDGMLVLRTPSPNAAFAEVAEQLYPGHDQVGWDPQPISSTAQIGSDVRLAPGVVVGPNAEIGGGTRIGPNTAVGPGVAIGRDCDIGSNISITHAYIGDHVQILPGAQIGQAGFGFVSGAMGHKKIPQLGRVIIQDGVEIGASTTIDRGALSDTVIGEGTKIDNLVQIGHNCRIGRHCVIVGQAGLSGSCELGDFVVLGGQVGLADHVRIGDRARLAARAGLAPGELPGGQDYGGAPAIPVREWRRQLAAVAMLGRRKRT